MSSNVNLLYISSITPDNGTIDISVSSSVKITFNRALNKSTVLRNMILIEDPTGGIESINDIDSKPYSVIQGTVKCNEHTVEFVPKTELLYGTRYIIYIRRNIASIYGDILMQDKLYSFTTVNSEYNDIIGIGDVNIDKPVITYPEANSILNKLDTIDFTIDANDYGAYIQLSNTNDFSNVLFEYKHEECPGSVYINKKLDDDNYYIRAKSFNSSWCEPIQIYIQNLEESPVCINDMFDSDFVNNSLGELGDNVEEDVQICIYPNGRIKSNVGNVKIEINKILDSRQIQDIYVSKIFDNMLDEELYSDIDFNSYSIYHDLDKTYLVLHLDK